MTQITTFPNGLRLITDDMPYVQSCSMGIWIKAGSRYETKQNNGVSHFLEHMLFKGTERRSAMDIARETDMIGGQCNAFTAKECTCIHAKCLSQHIDKAFDILSDMYHNSLLNGAELETERGVIKEEIDMCEDAPGDLCIDLLHEHMWQQSSLSLPILGTQQTLSTMQRDDLLNYRHSRYQPQNTIVAVSGQFDRSALVDLVQRQFSATGGVAEPWSEPSPVYTPCSITRQKEIEQNHLAIGFPGINNRSDDIFAVSMLANVLGGSTSSRLFQEIREKRGLAYSVYAFTNRFLDTGAFTIYAGMNADAQQETEQLIRQEVEDLAQNGITEEEFIRGREQIKANLIMGYESVSGRMSAIAHDELFRDHYMTLEEIVSKMDALQPEDIHRVATQILDWNKVSRCVVGNCNS